MLNEQHLHDLYDACCRTNTLWKNFDIEGFKQFDIQTNVTGQFNRAITKHIRLGQLAEQFIFHHIESIDDYHLIAENIQVKENQRTLGELDAIVNAKNRLVHLEMVYKFYVYDPSQGATEISRWIGPNRKDSLTEKLTKLKNKQFPLLYHEATQKLIRALGIDVSALEQQVLFKAQLFKPYRQNISFEQLNPECLKGFYIQKEQLKAFDNHVFYIPKKYDWLLDPHDNVKWLTLTDFQNAVDIYLSEQQSPLFWVKSPEDKFQKGFLVWW
ncbi:DUF1853 family protein [Psychroserpens sp.]|uniref:DUF1853 family protein n=1 Tax=Psychroserpens sp. TaxID=2020870 RepID=UPI001B28D716|nr:DUF1853 family protein [Psychroserpens sp.]MBO6606386.1 DUF1853 family protein [Psychroserpens sp.]MBO6631918.1 DUF1853 family protein [Psychroserpens sp.]MBO6653090.1 DUF1853 family protein [Psychroserpens sp.]MBO6680882.1 DUF1853 family protein [Psychroserpens sp.]MBO6750160.1 DUF1853 family protein [Psychroserpens sp.]